MSSEGRYGGLTTAERNEAASHLIDQFPEGLPSPREIEELIIGHGFRGQERVRRQGATLLYTHLKRALRLLLGEESPSSIGARQNHLFIGASGSGKTFLIEILERIAGVPVIIEDLTQYTETGIVGEDVSTIMSRLYQKAGKRRGIAAMGIVVLDELDKLAVTEGDRRNGAAPRLGVQRSLLTLLGSAQYDFPATVQNWTRAERKTIPMHGITFVMAGAFSGIERLDGKKENHAGVGFQASPRRSGGEIFPSLAENLLESTDVFIEYGLVPELLGRINHIARFDPLNRQTLGEILDNNILPAYAKQFEDEGLRLEISEPAREILLNKALARQTAARGIEAALSPAIEEAVYNYFGQDFEVGEKRPTVRLVSDCGRVRPVIGAEVAVN